MLSWVVPRYTNPSVATIHSYQIFAYEVVLSEEPNTDNWTQIGYVEAMELPMACTMSQVNITVFSCSL